MPPAACQQGEQGEAAGPRGLEVLELPGALRGRRRAHDVNPLAPLVAKLLGEESGKLLVHTQDVMREQKDYGTDAGDLGNC